MLTIWAKSSRNKEIEQKNAQMHVVYLIK